MGANVANEVAAGQFCEATVGYDGPVGCPRGQCTCGHGQCGCTADAHAGLWIDLLQSPTFRLSPSPDCATVELCGALKNVIALGSGFVDALGQGTNTKAAVVRRGLLEMRTFCTLYCAGKLGPVASARTPDPPLGTTAGTGGPAPVSTLSCPLPEPRLETFLESCGIADLVTSCFGGRNRKCAEAFARLQLEAHGDLTPTPAEASRVWERVERELLQGQKMQGLSTCLHVHELIQGQDGGAGVGTVDDATAPPKPPKAPKAGFPPGPIPIPIPAPAAANQREDGKQPPLTLGQGHGHGQAQLLMDGFPLMRAIYRVCRGEISPAHMLEAL